MFMFLFVCGFATLISTDSLLEMVIDMNMDMYMDVDLDINIEIDTDTDIDIYVDIDIDKRPRYIHWHGEVQRTNAEKLLALKALISTKKISVLQLNCPIKLIL
jgi:hypothetical protein